MLEPLGRRRHAICGDGKSDAGPVSVRNDGLDSHMVSTYVHARTSGFAKGGKGGKELRDTKREVVVEDGRCSTKRQSNTKSGDLLTHHKDPDHQPRQTPITRRH